MHLVLNATSRRNEQPTPFDAYSPAAKVDIFYPGLREETSPAAKRRYRGLLHMAEIAAAFREKQLAGVADPAAAIARERQSNPSTVRSWIHRARQAGLLDGQPPENPTGESS